MTNETLFKGNELVKQIEEIKTIINKLSYRKGSSISSELARPSFRDRKWLLRLFNQDKKSIYGNNEGAEIIIFDNISSCGSEILLQEEDSELLDIIIEYYNNKQKRLEEELASL